MTGKEFKERKVAIQELLSSSAPEQAEYFTLQLVEELFEEHKFGRIVELFYSELCEPPERFYSFEIAYALTELSYVDEAEEIYEHLLDNDSSNSLLLNNLSSIKQLKRQIDEAFVLIQKAYELDPQDEAIARNYHSLLAIVQKQGEIQEFYKTSLTYLQEEDDAVIRILSNFINNIQKEPEFEHHQMPIPEWQFSVVMEVAPQTAMELLEDWLEKGYVRYTGERGDHLIPIYEINPFLEEELEQVEDKQLPPKWLSGFDELTIENLERFSYFRTLSRIRKIKKKYREIAERDFNELFLNYLMKNEKAVIVLSGSLVEVILLYYCEKKKITTLYLPRKNNKTEKRELYECDLAEILNYLKNKKILSDIFVHVGNISRIYRNFIHPGKELREMELLNQSKSDLCFISALEIINTLLS